MNWRMLVALAGAAAGLMYLFDPDAGARRRAQMRGDALGVATETAPARVGETLEPALRLLSTLGGALVAVWGLRRLDELVDALGELVQG